MNIDEMKTNWQSVNTRLDALEAAPKIREGQKASRSLKWEPSLEIAVSALTLLWSGGFLANNWPAVERTPAGALPALFLYAVAIFTIWVAVRQLIVVCDLDYSKPVVETQRQLAAIRTLKVRSTQIMLLAGLPLWVLMPIFLGQNIAGYESFFRWDTKWVVANLVFGALASVGSVLAARRMGTQSLFLRKVDEALAGTAIANAQRLVGEVERFEKS